MSKDKDCCFSRVPGSHTSLISVRIRTPSNWRKKTSHLPTAQLKTHEHIAYVGLVQRLFSQPERKRIFIAANKRVLGSCFHGLSSLGRRCLEPFELVLAGTAPESPDRRGAGQGQAIWGVGGNVIRRCSIMHRKRPCSVEEVARKVHFA